MQRTQNNTRQALAEMDDAAGGLHGDIVADFLGSLDERLSALDGAAAQGDSASVLQAAHRLRGAAENLGLQALGALCQRPEGAALKQQVDLAALAGWRAASDAARAALSAALDALPRP